MSKVIKKMFKDYKKLGVLYTPALFKIMYSIFGVFILIISLFIEIIFERVSKLDISIY